MKNRSFSVIFLFFIFVASVFLFGCSHEKIKFYRESAASSLMNKFGNQNEKIKPMTSSGVIILNTKKPDYKININFGPRDINFDMPTRFK